MNNKINIELDKTTAFVLKSFLDHITLGDIQKCIHKDKFVYKTETIDMATTILNYELEDKLK